MGFEITEQMTGSHTFEQGQGPRGRHPLQFRAIWGPRRLRDWLNPLGDRFLWQELSGEIQIGGLTDGWVPCQGQLELRYFRDRSIRYVFDLDVDGELFRFKGEKVNILPWNLATSHTTCFGVLVRLSTGELVSTSVTHFRLWTALPFLASLRWRG